MVKASQQYLPVEDRIYISTSCVAGDRSLSTVLDKLAKLSVRNVELSGPHPYVPHDLLASELLGYKKTGMSFIVHNYFPQPETDFVLNIASFDENVIENSRNLINNALDLAREIGALFYGCHAGYLADAEAKTGYFQFNVTSVQSPKASLNQTAGTVNGILKNRGGNLPSGGMLLENLFPAGPQKNFSLACTPGEIKSLFGAFNHPTPGLLLDLSHLELTCQLYGLSPEAALQEVIDTMGDLIRCVHLSGNDGRTDSHAPLEPDAWQLHAARRLNTLRGTGSGLFFTLECRKLDDKTLLSQMNQLLNCLEK